MQGMMETQTKLLVPCIESLGLTTGAQKKEKAMVQNNLNMTFNYEELIALQLRLSLPDPSPFHVIQRLKEKFARFKEVLTYFLQCIMKCVMIKGKMVSNMD